MNDDKDNEIIEGEILEVELASENPLAIMPAMSLDQAAERYDAFKAFVKSQMKEGLDYGIIPGTPKPTLYQPGAEKLYTFFGFALGDPILLDNIERWDMDDPFFYFRYLIRVMRGDVIVAGMEGSCNSKESRYAWRWVKGHDVSPDIDKSMLESKTSLIEEFGFAIDQRQTQGDWGKPLEYWDKFSRGITDGTAEEFKKKTRKGEELLAYRIVDVLYRIPNPDIFSLVNTIQKMAQKRAFVGAVIRAANASEYFTHDLEDNPQAFGMSEPKAVEKKEAAQPKSKAKPRPADKAKTKTAQKPQPVLEFRKEILEAQEARRKADTDGDWVMDNGARGILISAIEQNLKGKRKDLKSAHTRLQRHGIYATLYAKKNKTIGYKPSDYLMAALLERWDPQHVTGTKPKKYAFNQRGKHELKALWEHWVTRGTAEMKAQAYGDNPELIAFIETGKPIGDD